VIEAIKISKSDIYRYVADPAFVTVPTLGLLSRDFTAARRALFDPARAIAYPSAGVPAGVAATAPRADGPIFDEAYDAEQHTTSFSIVDRFGNAVGCTPTLGGLFGTNVVVGTTGLLLNNGMRLGSTSPYPTDVNYVGAGKIPILNNAPVVVLKDGKLAFVFGTPGGETIGQTELQVLLNLIDFQMPVQPAIESPRLALDAEPNFYKPGAAITVRLEGRVAPATIDALKAMGHTVRVLPGWGSLGHMQVIRIDQTTGAMTAGADPRRTGYAIGY
jgi:gamma-glutamyltranspeptidase/glutathione hydrolase